MRTLLISILLTGLVGFGTANACDDHFGTCEVEDWVYRHEYQVLELDGVTTCSKGIITIRLYENGKFLGVTYGLIDGHAFQAMSISENSPATLEIKYSINTEV